MEKIQRANNAHDHFRPDCLYLTNRFTFWIRQDGNTLEWFFRMLF
jgi:hypothetical protein